MENPASSNPQGAPDKTPVSLARVLKVVVPLAVVLLAGAWAISMYVPSAAKKELESNELERLLGKAVEEETLPAWTDQNQDLLADPPPADKCITPDTLRFSYVATQEAGDEANIWQGWLEALSEKTGVQTQYVHYDSVNDQLNAMKNGELHVTAVNTGAVPRAVKEAGFVPVSTFGKDGQFGYTMNLIVRDDSGLKTPADLRGHNITFVRPSSNSGFKAALVYLMTECDLLPGRDYTYRFSMSHDASVRAVADGETDARPLPATCSTAWWRAAISIRPSFAWSISRNDFPRGVGLRVQPGS